MGKIKYLQGIKEIVLSATNKKDNFSVYNVDFLEQIKTSIL